MATTSLSIGVNPRTTVFDKVFLSCTRGGCSILSQLQAVQRFGRFENGLNDPNIVTWLSEKSPETRCREEDAGDHIHANIAPHYSMGGSNRCVVAA